MGAGVGDVIAISAVKPSGSDPGIWARQPEIWEMTKLPEPGMVQALDHALCWLWLSYYGAHLAGGHLLDKMFSIVQWR